METTCTIGLGQTPAEAARCAGSYIGWTLERWASAFGAVFSRTDQATIADWLIVVLTLFFSAVYVADRLMKTKARLEGEHRARLKARNIEGSMPLSRSQALGLVVAWTLLMAAVVLALLWPQGPRPETWVLGGIFLPIFAVGYFFILKAIRTAFSQRSPTPAPRR